MKLSDQSLSSLFYTFFTLLLFTSCAVNDSNNIKKVYSYKIKKGASIVIDTTKRGISSNNLMEAIYFSIEKGNKTVFIYNFKSIPPEEIADGGFSEEMVFQIPSGVQKFEYRDDELANAKVYYRYSCYCAGAGIGYDATQGVIKGKQLNSSQWLIQADVRFKSQRDNFTVQFEKRFTIKH